MPGTASANAKPYVSQVPYEDTADYRRAKYAEANRLIRERNLAKQAELDALATMPDPDNEKTWPQLDSTSALAEGTASHCTLSCNADLRLL